LLIEARSQLGSGLFLYPHIFLWFTGERTKLLLDKNGWLMASYVAKRVRFQNGERHSVLQVPYGLPVQEVTLYLDKYRRKGRAANTIHFVCLTLALLYRELDKAKVDLLGRLTTGQFLTIPELNRLASAAQYRVDDLDEEAADEGKPKVIGLSRFRLRRSARATERKGVDVGIPVGRGPDKAAFRLRRSHFPVRVS
jgi:hypothetical protein